MVRAGCGSRRVDVVEQGGVIGECGVRGRLRLRWARGGVSVCRGAAVRAEVLGGSREQPRRIELVVPFVADADRRGRGAERADGAAAAGVGGAGRGRGAVCGGAGGFVFGVFADW